MAEGIALTDRAAPGVPAAVEEDGGMCTRLRDPTTGFDSVPSVAVFLMKFAIQDGQNIKFVGKKYWI